MHGTRNIHDEDIFAGRDHRRGNLGGRLHHQQEEVLFFAGIQQQSGFDAAAGQPVFQHVIPIAARFLRWIERDIGRCRAIICNLHFVRRTDQLLNRDTGTDTGLDIERIWRRFPFVEVGIFHPAFRRACSSFGLVGISGTNHGGIGEFIYAIGGHQQFGIAEFHPDHVSWQNIGHIHLKDVRPLLLQKGGALAFLFGLFVFLTGFFLFLNFGDDGALADGHFHGIHRRTGGCRKDINGFDRLLAGVLIHLSDLHIGDDTGNPDIGAGGLERQLFHAGIVAFDPEIRRQGFGVGCFGLGMYRMN